MRNSLSSLASCTFKPRNGLNVISVYSSATTSSLNWSKLGLYFVSLSVQHVLTSDLVLSTLLDFLILKDFGVRLYDILSYAEISIYQNYNLI